MARAEKLSTIAVAFYTFLKDSPLSKVRSKADCALEIATVHLAFNFLEVDLGLLLYSCTETQVRRRLDLDRETDSVSSRKRE